MSIYRRCDRCGAECVGDGIQGCEVCLSCNSAFHRWLAERWPGDLEMGDALAAMVRSLSPELSADDPRQKAAGDLAASWSAKRAAARSTDALAEVDRLRAAVEELGAQLAAQALPKFQGSGPRVIGYCACLNRIALGARCPVCTHPHGEDSGPCLAPIFAGELSGDVRRVLRGLAGIHLGDHDECGDLAREAGHLLGYEGRPWPTEP